MPDPLMKIGQLAKRAKVSHRTIHYYENIGLIAPVRREGGVASTLRGGGL
ncbi:MerR family transcriptional regulator [Salipiger mucosus]|uniref:Transcriptional regulator, MerR family n=1 Tax=Salipiger mucosus DSM 16094 TaxID=1123237 RepID=S9RE41_9RHOB|nr:MerR family transcriptional regulator [Salipiger mucosus]EPX76395.1 Transcriptional regulator, MerR family [Salipiger mucosus DSM 16094]